MRKVINFSIFEGCDEFTSWEKHRREYLRTLGHELLICNENDIFQIFDSWERQIHDLIKVDKNYNYFNALLIISLLHYFNRSYDQIKEYIPFLTKILESKNRKLICSAIATLRYLSEESPENIDFLRDIVARYARKWITTTSTRYSALKLLLISGKFLLPTVFEVTSSSFQVLWASVICDDVEVRTVAAKVVSIHLSGLPKSYVSDANLIFKDCITQMKLLNTTSHGPILVCRYLLYNYPEEIDVPLLINCLFDLFTVKSEVIIVAVSSLLYEIIHHMTNLFTAETVRIYFTGLINGCSRYPSLTELFETINKTISFLNPSLIPIQNIVDFLRTVVKSPKFRSQNNYGFKILKNLFKINRNLTVPASFFLDADLSPSAVHALRMRMALFNDTKNALLKSFNEGLSAKANQNQIILSLHILKSFDSHIFTNKDQIYSQIRHLKRSTSEEIRLLIVEVLPLFDNQSSLDDLLFLALFDSSKQVRAAAVKELKFPTRLAHCDMITQLLSDPSFKVKRNAIPIVASITPYNPIQFYVPISSFVERTIIEMVSSSNPCICARISTVMPLIAQQFIHFCPAFIPQLVKACYLFLKNSFNNENKPKPNKKNSNNNKKDENNNNNNNIIKSVNNNNNDDDNSSGIHLDDVVIKDMSHDGHPLITNKLPYDESCTNLIRIFHIENKEWIDKRDSNLFLTLQNLAPHLLDYVHDLIPVFVDTFNSNRSNNVYIAALDALTDIVVKNAIVISVPYYHQDLVPTLMQLLNTKPSDEVAVKILQLMGSLGITSFPNSLIEQPGEKDPITDFDFKSPSFYTDFTMTAVLKLLDEPHSSIFEAVTSIFVKDVEAAAKFLPQVVAAFVKSISTSKGSQREELFKQLEVISFYSGPKMQPFVDQIIPHVVQNIRNTAALRVTIVLSYFLKSEFIISIQPVFQKVLNIIDLIILDNGNINATIASSASINNSSSSNIIGSYGSAGMNINTSLLSGTSGTTGNNGTGNTEEMSKYYETLFTLLTSAIVFQNQSLSTFVVECERIVQSGQTIAESFLPFVVSSLTTIVQLSDCSFECAHITRLCMKLLKVRNFDKSQVFQLLYSLCVYCNMAPSCIDSICRSEGVFVPFGELTLLKEYERNKMISLDQILPKRKIKVRVDIPDYVPLKVQQAYRVFDDFQPPQFNNTAKWLEDLSVVVVSESPSYAIRSCRKLVKNSPSFRNEIFPIAFLSCWLLTKRRTQKNFSAILQDIFETDKQLDPIFLRLAELLLRSGHPLNISSLVIASACHSPSLALRFLFRHVEEFPTDLEALEMMLTLNMRLGRIGNSRGILKRINISMQLQTAGSWYEKLGQWEEALEFYQKMNDKKSLIRCLAKLERLDEVRSMAKFFNEEMSAEEQKENALWFAWAFYRANDLQKVSYYVEKFGETDDPEVLIFKEIFLVASNQNKSAKTYIEKFLNSLVKDCSVYSALNANLTAENLMYANCLVELQEAVEMKKNNIKEMPAIWCSRLNSLAGDSYDWMKLVEIRNLALSITENKMSYLKLLSISTKERQWALADAILKQMTALFDDPEVQLAYHKMLWARYEKIHAIESLHFLNLMYRPEITEQEFMEEIKDMSPSSYDFHIKLFNLNGQNDAEKFDPKEIYELFLNRRNNSASISNKLRSRFLRIEGSWRSQLYQKSESLPSLIKTIDLFKEAASLCPNDYRNWEGFAYAASRAIDDISFVTSALDGFLRVSQLRTSNNLEYLCPLFSLFFRYGSKVSFPSEIVNLDPEIICQVLPQIVCQINHPDRTVQNVVHKLLIRFGEKHFEALVFSLHLLTRSEGDEGKVRKARELLTKLSSNHTQLAKEAEIFVEGLLRAAVTWYETWMNRLDAAFIASFPNYARGTHLLRQLFESRKYPQCPMDSEFNKVLESPLATCANTLDHFQPTEGSFNLLWNQLKRLYEIIRDKFKMIESIQLSSVSAELSNMRNFLLSIPGTYSVYGNSPRIQKIDQTLPVLTTQQHPRLLFMTDTSGRQWKFLLKGNEDLRLDQRIMQFFNLINSLIKTNKVANKLRVSISKYAIIPISPNAGLISWVTGANTMHQLVMDQRRSNGMSLWAENEEIQSFVGDIFDALNSCQKREIWNLVAPNFPATELRDMFWEKAQDAVTWIKVVDQFVVSTALMSMAGYVIGLGDRHPCNIMIQRQTGRVVHIDFGDSFEVAMNRDRMPEKVPFRLTRMLVNAFGVSRIEGPFRNTCETILRVLRNNKSSITAQLEIFVHEPIFVNRDNGGTLDRIIEKLSGNDPKSDDSTKELTIEEQVNNLIEIASDPSRYVLHYIGWCQFW